MSRKNLQIQFKSDTGHSCTSTNVTVDKSEFIHDYYLLDMDELERHMRRPDALEIINPVYVEWLERKLEELQNV